MSWVTESSYIQKFVINVIKNGKIPRHVSFIMDGNRRYAKKFNLVRSSGHLQGFETLSKILGWCKDLGISEISIFAFSYENFNRSPDEVDDILSIAKEKLQLLISELDKINEHGICVRFWGEINRLPEDMQQLVAKIEIATMTNSKAFLNICFAYTSSREITHAFNTLKDGVEEKLIKTSDISESLLEKCLYSVNSSPPDLVIRTSGEIRLSDYLLWQSGFSLLCFVKTLWPEFSFYDLIGCIIKYQKHSQMIEKSRKQYIIQRDWYEKQLFSMYDLSEDQSDDNYSNRIKNFLAIINQKHIKELQLKVDKSIDCKDS